MAYMLSNTVAHCLATKNIETFFNSCAVVKILSELWVFNNIEGLIKLKTQRIPVKDESKKPYEIITKQTLGSFMNPSLLYSGTSDSTEVSRWLSPKFVNCC